MTPDSAEPKPLPEDSPVTATDREIAAHVDAAVQVADRLKAIDLTVIHLAPVTDFTDYFLICSGSNDRQVAAIGEQILRGLRDRGLRPLHEEGLNKAQWVLLDYGDFVVHVFDEEKRRFYALERLWSDAEDVTERFLSAEA